MKIKDLRNMSESELRKNLADLKVELMKHNAQVAIGTAPKSPGLIRKTKKSIARILTLLHQRSSQQEKTGAVANNKKQMEGRSKL